MTLNSNRRRVLSGLSATAAPWLATGPARAQAWPARPI